MASIFLDTDEILSNSEQWSRLEEEWGQPIDLDMEEELTREDSSILNFGPTAANSCIAIEHLLEEPTEDYNEFVKNFNQFSGQFNNDRKYDLSSMSPLVDVMADEVDSMFESIEILACFDKKQQRRTLYTTRNGQHKSERKESRKDNVNLSTSDVSEELARESNINRRGGNLFIRKSQTITELVKKFSLALYRPAVERKSRRPRHFVNVIEIWKN
ncbi:uncharacterized protein LOC116413422 [Galleria mellonella]|uniref:Uncharacterized protein LOC116413422 n=1 Tax=Galleria mellonella TaxID=7137 RepID=A0A6J3CBK8_GALME|nr:uncharacterized protein LOC116413422 [Galleria mellonella]